MRFDPRVVEELSIHQLARVWHCTPDQARAQPAEDVEFALALLESEHAAAEIRRASEERRQARAGR